MEAIERALGAFGCQCSEARHAPAALRHMHDIVTCGGVDGGSIKPPDTRSGGSEACLLTLNNIHLRAQMRGVIYADSETSPRHCGQTPRGG